MIDTRNAYEVQIGTFRGAVDPGTRSFRAFPDWWKAHRNRFAGNGTAVRYWESDPVIADNDFEGNGTAIFCREGSRRSVVRGNNFLASADYHVKLGESQGRDVDARGNWWGSARPEEIEQLIFDREDVPYLGRVRYRPPAPGPRSTAPPE